ncbi:hypothetical protein VTK56DRAFT_1207 [Thermocarpiscus australiensis]
MVPMRGPLGRGRSRARADDASDDEDSTVYSDADSISSRSTASDDVFSSRDRQEMAPVFRLNRDEQNKSVYEAWNIHFFPDRRVAAAVCKVLGIRIENYEIVDGNADVWPKPSAQSELAEMHLRAIEEFRTKNKRCWAARAYRGRGRTYERDLEERCRELPHEVRAALTQLVLDRGRASSTRYRTRTWTVVALREQLRHRYAETGFTDVKRHKIRFWKNPSPEEPVLYTVVIRGAETKAHQDENGIKTFGRLSNPWMDADHEEIHRKSQKQHQQRETLRRKSPEMSPAYRAGGERYASPPSYRSGRNCYASPPPPIRNRRYESPPPYRSRPGHSPARTPSPSVCVRLLPKFGRSTDNAPVPPTARGPFISPPGLSAYNRPTMASAPLPTTYDRSFHPRPPTVNPGIRYPPRPAARPLFGPYPGNGADYPGARRNCVACWSPRTQPCGHCSQSLICCRPIRLLGGALYHPPCFTCLAYNKFPGPASVPPAAPSASPLTPPMSGSSVPNAPTSNPPHSAAAAQESEGSHGSAGNTEHGGRMEPPPTPPQAASVDMA